MNKEESPAAPWGLEQAEKYDGAAAEPPQPAIWPLLHQARAVPTAGAPTSLPRALSWLIPAERVAARSWH